MNYTGVYATEEEYEDLKRLVQKGWQEGDVMIVTSIMQGIVKDQATINAKIACHKLALKKGLKEINGYYGITKNREFACY